MAEYFIKHRPHGFELASVTGLHNTIYMMDDMDVTRHKFTSKLSLLLRK